MAQFIEYIKSSPYLLLIAAVVIVFYIVMMMVTVSNRKKMKAKERDFTESNSDAIRVYLTRKVTDIEPAQIFSVNDVEPVRFMDGTKTGFYLKPGKSQLEVQYSYTRPGVVHKSVTRSTDIIKITVAAELGQEYYLNFDKKSEEFTFIEL